MEDTQYVSWVGALMVELEEPLTGWWLTHGTQLGVTRATSRFLGDPTNVGLKRNAVRGNPKSLSITMLHRMAFKELCLENYKKFDFKHFKEQLSDL